MNTGFNWEVARVGPAARSDGVWGQDEASRPALLCVGRALEDAGLTRIGLGQPLPLQYQPGTGGASRGRVISGHFPGGIWWSLGRDGVEGMGLVCGY